VVVNDMHGKCYYVAFLKEQLVENECHEAMER
jgi:hypothetical protein